MTYRVPEPDIAGYYREGYIVFRDILEPSLITDLRRQADRAAALCRAKSGPQAQRLQPVSAWAAELDLAPFKAYAQHPGLRDALDQLLTPDHRYGDDDVLGVLLNPTESAWCTPWHRDMTLKSSRLPQAEFDNLMLDWNSANQVNAPLYDDDCTWFVPGSHLRSRDLPGETAAAHDKVPATAPASWGGKPIGDDTPCPAAIERQVRQYVLAMPGAVQLRLHAGDFCLYRPIGWHIGAYSPYKRRATLHDVVMAPVFEAWWRAWRAGESPRWTLTTQRD